MQEPKFIKEIKEPKNANYLKVCQMCEREFKSVRVDARFCCPLCKSKYARMVKATPEPKKPVEGKKTTIFDFVEYIRSGYGDYGKLQTYLKEQCGISKTDTKSVKKMIQKLNEWNSQNGNRYTLTKKQGKDGTHIVLVRN